MLDIFLDRDGVINHNRADHVKSWEEFEFLPGSLEALALLHKMRYRVFVITNQAAINRGILTELQLRNLHDKMNEQISIAGGSVEAVLYCPHRPEELCSCRKPEPGLLKQAQYNYKAQLAGSWLIGDHLHDIKAGQLVDCRTMLVKTGRGSQSYASYLDAPTQFQQPVQVAEDLAQAVEQILLMDAIEQQSLLSEIVLANFGGKEATPRESLVYQEI